MLELLIDKYTIEVVQDNFFKIEKLLLLLLSYEFSLKDDPELKEKSIVLKEWLDTKNKSYSYQQLNVAQKINVLDDLLAKIDSSFVQQVLDAFLRDQLILELEEEHSKLDDEALDQDVLDLKDLLYGKIQKLRRL